MSSASTTPEEVPTADALVEIYDSFVGYKPGILKAALELGVWAKVAAGQGTAEEMVQNEGWDPTGTRMLLDVLCGMGLLAKDGNGYRLVPLAEYYLLPEKPTYMGNYLLAEIGWDGHGLLAQAIRTGKRPLVKGLTSEEEATIWAGYYAPYRAAPERWLEVFDARWRSLGIKAREGLRVLDVACGAARMSLALARHHHGVRVTLQDRPPLLALAMERAKKLGLSDQVTTLPGDLLSTDFGQAQFDLAWLGHILHFFGPKTIVELLSGVHRALVSGGAVVIDEVIADEARREQEYPLIGAIWLFCVSGEGDMYTLSELRKFLEEAGFVDVKQIGEQYIKAVKP